MDALALEPSAMRTPARYHEPRTIDPHGKGLPAALERLRAERGDAVLAEVANRLANLLPDVREVRVTDDPRTETYTLEVSGADGVFHPARALSDGTLRFLVLSVLAADPTATGVLCFEEPENGMHPNRVPAMVELLHDLAVDAQLPVDETNPRRQVLVNTHSPARLQAARRRRDRVVELSEVIQGPPGHHVDGEGAGGELALTASAIRGCAPAAPSQWRQMSFEPLWATEE